MQDILIIGLYWLRDEQVIQETAQKYGDRLLVVFYEYRDNGEITEFMRSLCWRTF